MGKAAGQIGRRAALSFIVAAPMIARRAVAEPVARYSVDVRPARALLGDRLRLGMECRTSRTASVTTFEDASLVLAMARRSSRAEPELAFPNHKAVQQGNRLVRLGGAVRRDLQPGERLDREFDLVSVFPRLALDTGEFRAHYELDDGGRVRRVGPASVTVESGPDAIPSLLVLLSHENAEVRERAAGLIHRMTAYVVGYGAQADADERRAAADRWKKWWGKTGRTLPWNFQSPGATFGVAASAAPRNRRSHLIGGIAYGQQPLGSVEVRAVSSALSDWLRMHNADVAALQGSNRVADHSVVYPSDGTMVEADGDVVRLLTSALLSSAREAASTPRDSSAVMLILATMAKMPDRRFVPALEALRGTISKVPAWHRVDSFAAGLLEVVDPSRTPTGDEG
jgi:hypothetical protein